MFFVIEYFEEFLKHEGSDSQKNGQELKLKYFFCFVHILRNFFCRNL